LNPALTLPLSKNKYYETTLFTQAQAGNHIAVGFRVGAAQIGQQDRGVGVMFEHSVDDKRSNVFR